MGVIQCCPSSDPLPTVGQNLKNCAMSIKHLKISQQYFENQYCLKYQRAQKMHLKTFNHHNPIGVLGVQLITATGTKHFASFARTSQGAV